WKKTTSNAALFATVGGFIFSVVLKFSGQLMDLEFLSAINFAVPNAQGVYEIPFIDRMAIVFLLCVIGMVIISKIDNARGVVPNGLEVDSKMFKAHPAFIIGSAVVIIIVTALYTIYW
ncbi:sodium transporter, partial [Parapusillimonas sp. SGNA-6]|nr:sodium transporter [Parapusillimonas sp. SGNA-6]